MVIPGDVPATAGGRIPLRGTRRWLLVIGAIVSLAFAVLVWVNGDLLLQLSDRGNVLRTNDMSGITRDTASALLGRIEFIALALAALFGQAALGTSRSTPGSVGRWVRAPALWAVALIVVFTFALLDARSIRAGGKLFFHLEDDAMISMRYARNFAAGAGLVYNVGERVEGYTDFLWVLIMAAAHLIVPARLASALIIVLNAAFACFELVLVQAMLQASKIAVPLIVLTCLALAADANLVMWISSGLEAVAMAACVTTCAWALLESDRTSVFLVSLAAIPLVRSDGALLAVMLGGVFLVTRPSARALLQLAVATVPTFLHFAFRLAYYGHPFPNTYYLKMIGPRDRLMLGLGGYGFRFLGGYLVLIALVAYVAMSKHFAGRLRLLAGVVFGQVAYSIYVGGDTFWYLRFIMPVIPLAYALGALGIERLLAGAEPRRATLVAGTLLTMLPSQSFDGRLGEVVPTHDFLRAMLATADTLRANLAPGESMSIYSAGTVPYFAPEIRFVDVLGKTESHIGHQPSYIGRVIGHNKFDFEWIFGTRKPDVAFTALSCDLVDDFENLPELERQRRVDAVTPDVFVAPLYELQDSHFRSQYFPGQVTIERRGSVLPNAGTAPAPGANWPSGCFFVRRDSPIPRHWTYAE
jgi:arabinofuranosyltransferase